MKNGICRAVGSLSPHVEDEEVYYGIRAWSIRNGRSEPRAIVAGGGVSDFVNYYGMSCTLDTGPEYDWARSQSVSLDIVNPLTLFREGNET